ncbi:hypothetical protein MAR_014418 [Mya arenaria]|uniref:Uncharacterized protein n=1 Tax=Mya arenaria TaxID=6604 RepID=A0ABY7G5W2_MYAAR|nr:hypothetical protein MAR_014418 [Mya arenaria]
MQRKKTRSHFGDNFDLGTSLLPSSRSLMRKFKMKKIIQYLVFVIGAFILYSVYQKMNIAKENDRHPSDSNWKVSESNLVDVPSDEKHEEIANRRVKEEINKVFEDFKQQQADKNAEKVKNIRLNEDDFGNDIDDGRDDIPDNDKPFYDDDVETGDDVFGNNEDESNNDDNAGGKRKDFGDHFEEVVQDAFDEINEEEEKEDLKLEKEIEERLADVLKDAVDEVAEDEAEKGKADKYDAVNQKVGVPLADQREVQVPEVKDVFDKKEYKVAVNNMGRRLNPLEINQLNGKAAYEAKRKDDDHEFPPFVTAARQSQIKEVTQLVASLQHNLPSRKIYIYDLDLTKDQKKHTALAEFGHITWINPQFRLGTQELAPLLHESHELGIMVVGQSASYSTYSATHPKMLEFIPSDTEKLSFHPHIEIRAIVIHNTDDVHQHVMKMFAACALEENCLAPPGSKRQCKFDFTGRKPADCHRYDESALNILLKNWFDFDMNKFARRNNYFRPYDKNYKPKLKICRNIQDIRESEL